MKSFLAARSLAKKELYFGFTLAFDSHLRGPSFVMEPPPRLEFSNSSGGWLDCSASGSPQPTIDWLSVDGTSVGDVGGVRRVLRNGTLVLLPFPAAAFRQDIHNTIYRCVASNTVGRVISRDVQVRAASDFQSRVSRSNSIRINQHAIPPPPPPSHPQGITSASSSSPTHSGRSHCIAFRRLSDSPLMPPTD
ncbi:hypothetical protein RP20_CCG026065 [Aedes albopictus]|nr:hypothetical protein RP20_CCG026065 [Aedes albopictus]